MRKGKKAFVFKLFLEPTFKEREKKNKLKKKKHPELWSEIYDGSQKKCLNMII